ncbi:MAG: hypothetical protein U0521_20350 [Anaerolineae bacterium]
MLWLDVNDTPLPELLARVGDARMASARATSDNPLNQVNAAINAHDRRQADGRHRRADQPTGDRRVHHARGDRVPILILSDTEIRDPGRTSR